MTPDAQKIYEIFFPFASTKEKEIKASKNSLVHYTSAEAGLNIISSAEFWMREASCMNDYTEVVHGIQCVLDAYNGEPGTKLKKALNNIHPDIIEKFENLFAYWLPHFPSSTFLSCFSQHDEEKENDLGRLSMWRAYGLNTGVAIVLNSEVFFNDSEYFNGLYTSPVAYLGENEFAVELIKVSTNIEKNIDVLQSIDTDIVIYALFRSLMFAALCTKHKGFAEELEWRLTYVPKFEPCPNITEDCKTLKGIPQIIQKIPLKNVQEVNLTGLSIPELINRIIIGPSQYAAATQRAFIKALESKGDLEAASKVVISGTPLRV